MTKNKTASVFSLLLLATRIVFLHNKKSKRDDNIGIDICNYILYNNIMYQNGKMCLTLWVL